MPKTVDTQHLIRQLERLNQRLSEIVARDFPNLTNEQLNWREKEGKWSIAECLTHLNYVADYYFPATLKTIASAQARKTKPLPTFTRGWLGHYYVSKFRLRPDNQVKNKLESPLKYNPQLISSSQLNGATVIKDFLERQQLIDKMLSDSKTINIQKARVYALFFGFVNIRLGDMLKMLIYHTERHIVQAQRILYHDYFPGNFPLDALFSEREN
ncbi:DinB family protein [Aureispira anguillae]|uniref:DinB family protein n=1 Tax=Aureispira anguillae TaxID=2864201 RepID=A0A916DS70_9BACT|nr:DinB family protein [Aureispira anguillae]BDS11691.1 DinB family protein [Aureispira anguillae]